MQRVSVVGVSGAGKTTVARALAARLRAPLIELDAVFHQPGWVALDEAEFLRRVDAATVGPSWVVDGNYSSQVQKLVWSRADTVVVLDLPRWRVMSQLFVRTLRRGWTGEELWNGNRESLRYLISLDRERNILLWSLTKHAETRRRYRAAATDPRWTHLSFVSVRSRRDGQSLAEAR